MRYQPAIRVLIAITVVFSLSAGMAMAATRPIPGKTCKNYKEKVEYKGAIYTCKKSGSKLIWSAALVLNASKKDQITAKPSATQASTKTYLERWNETGSQALTTFNSVFPKKEQKYQGINFIWRVSESVSPEISEEIKARYLRTSEFWSSYVQFPDPLQVIIGNLDDITFVCYWRNTHLKMTDSNCEKNFRKDKFRNWDAHTTQSDINKTDFYFMSDPKILNQIDFVPRVEHEFFHNVQHSKNSRYKFALPCWAEEAGAEYFGNLVSSNGNPEKYLKLRSFSINVRFGKITQGTSNPQAWKEWLYSTDMTSNIPNSPEWGCSPVQMEGIYHFGILATEYIHLKFGISGLLNLYENSGKVGWSVAIEELFGTSKDQAYGEIGNYMSQEYLISKSASWAGPYCENICTFLP